MRFLKATIVLLTVVLFIALWLSKFGRIVDRQASARSRAEPIAKVIRWTKPDPGWLYVVDSNKMRERSSVFLVNPMQQSVAGHIEAGYAPDVALSPDGKRLAIASGAPSWISVIDTETGSIIDEFPVPDRLVQAVRPSISGVGFSPDGHLISVVLMSGEPPDPVTYSVAFFDSRNGFTRDGKADLPACGPARIMWLNERQWAAHCYFTDDVRFFDRGGNGEITLTSSMRLQRWEPQPLPEGVLSLPDSVRRTVFLGILPGSKTLLSFSGRGGISSTSYEAKAPWKYAVAESEDRWVPARDWPVLPQRSRAFIGSGSLIDRMETEGQVNQIEVFDLERAQKVGTIGASVPFWSLAVSKDGQYLYATSPTNRVVLVIDASIGKEVGRLEGLGNSPSLALVAP